MTIDERKAYRRRWYLRNRKRILRLQRRKYRQSDKRTANAQSRKWAKNNPERRREIVAKTRKKYLSSGLCFYCGSKQAPSLTVCKFHSDQQLKCNSRYRSKLREEVIVAYGGKCVCCGESNPGFLTMDHPKNDGAEHRRRTGCGTGIKFYNWLRRNGYPKEFQVLCWNCNCGKRDNGGVCPHEELRRQKVAA